MTLREILTKMKKQTKVVCLILVFAAILNGCKKNEIQESDPVTTKKNDKFHSVNGGGGILVRWVSKSSFNQHDCL